MCNTCGKNNGSGSQQTNFNIFEAAGINKFPDVFETVAPGQDLTKDPERNANMLLESGQYKVRFTTDIKSDEARQPFTLKNFEIEVPVDNEYKRVKIFKMDSVPIDDETRKVTVKFALIDNPVWLAPVLWTLPAVGGWFVVDKVERFAESSPVNFGLLTLTAISALAFMFFK